MELKTFKLDELNPASYNPRKNLKPGDKEYEKIKNSIEAFGFVEPLIVNIRDGANRIVGGHQRYKVLKELGIKDTKCVIVDYDDITEKACNVALNKIGGDWEFTALADLLTELDTGAFDMELTGFDEDDLAQLLSWTPNGGGTAEEDDFDADAEAESIKEPTTKRGDIWLLGRHRVMCGDSTSAEDVSRLMDGKKADMVFTDPPYGIEKEGIQNDDLKGDDFYAFSKAYIDVLPVKSDCGIVCYHSTRTFYITSNAFVDGGWKFEKMLFFYRPDKMPVHTWNSWMMTSQAIMLFSKGKPEYAKVTPAHQDVYRVTSSDLTSKTVNHPTVKPVKNCTDLMSHYDAQLIYDPFLGSGTTLIAAEQLNRICYGVEISPVYCDVVVKRWEILTGKTAILESN